MARENVTKEQIKTLNQLGWDKKLFANFTGNGENWLECNFYLNSEAYRYRIDCETYADVEQLRNELEGKVSDDLLILAEYVKSSSYRQRALQSIGTDLKTPTNIAKDSGLRVNHISKVLKELKDNGLSVCINPEVRKGRLYRLTADGLQVLEML